STSTQHRVGLREPHSLPRAIGRPKHHPTRDDAHSPATSGGSGIRTHGEFPHTRFPSVPIRPLSHPSSAPRAASKRVIVLARPTATLRPRTVLGGESVVPCTPNPR